MGKVSRPRLSSTIIRMNIDNMIETMKDMIVELTDLKEQCNDATSKEGVEEASRVLKNLRS